MLIQSSNFQFLCMQDFVTTQLVATIRTLETMSFFFFNTKLKENKKNQKKRKRKKKTLRGTTIELQSKIQILSLSLSLSSQKKKSEHCRNEIPRAVQNNAIWKMNRKSQIPMSKNEKFYQLQRDFGETKWEMDRNGARAKKWCHFDFRERCFSLIFIIIDFCYFLLISNLKKKMQNGVVSRVLTASTNWIVTESCIDKNWKLEDWIDKTES